MEAMSDDENFLNWWKEPVGYDYLPRYAEIMHDIRVPIMLKDQTKLYEVLKDWMKEAWISARKG